MLILGQVVDIINNNGIGVIPTDTGYSFVTKISNREGTERVMELIGAKALKKPLSLLVKDLSTIRCLMIPYINRLLPTDSLT